MKFYVKTKCIHHKLLLFQVEGRIAMVTEENYIKKAASFSEDKGNALNNVKAQQTGIKDLSMVVWIKAFIFDKISSRFTSENNVSSTWVFTGRGKHDYSSCYDVYKGVCKNGSITKFMEVSQMY